MLRDKAGHASGPAVSDAFDIKRTDGSLMAMRTHSSDTIWRPCHRQDEYHPRISAV